MSSSVPHLLVGEEGEEGGEREEEEEEEEEEKEKEEEEEEEKEKEEEEQERLRLRPRGERCGGWREGHRRLRLCWSRKIQQLGNTKKRTNTYCIFFC